ncbi:hypothetical protein ACEPAI_9999 [Sanghuangporus weigelae]
MKLSKISRILESLRLKITPGSLRNFGRRPKLTNPGKHCEGHLSTETIPSHECEDGISIEELEGLPDDTSDEIISGERNGGSNTAQENQLENGLPFRRRKENGWELSLPLEILLKIFALAMEKTKYGRGSSSLLDREPIKQLRSLALVCQAWYLIATPMLFNDVIVWSPTRLASFANAIAKHPRLRPLVHSIRYESLLHMGMSRSETENLKLVHRLCTNLSRLYFRRPSDGSLCCDRQVIDTIGLDASRIVKLTSLEITLPEGLPCGDKLIFSSQLCLPALQEFIVDVFGAECMFDSSPSMKHEIGWPRMPHLSRFCIKHCKTTQQCFSFPSHSNKLRVIELLDGDYGDVVDFFRRDILRYKDTLERLTITACDIGGSKFDDVTLEEFIHLTELCIPLSTFAKWDNIGLRLPSSALRRLVITGLHEHRRNIMVSAEKNLFDLLLWKSSGTAVENLEFIYAEFESPWMYGLLPEVSFQRVVDQAADAGVDMQLGRIESSEKSA